MQIVLLADAFPPMRSSAAVQLKDLAAEFLRQGHATTVIVPSSDIGRSWSCEKVDGITVLRLRAPPTKNIGYVRRTIGEILMPVFMWWNLRTSPFSGGGWEGVVWYSPSIFLGPVAQILKKRCRCRGYLIVRDIFPEWAVDMGLLKRRLPYYFFKVIERFQYSVADVIGVQTPGNLAYFDAFPARSNRRVEVLQNWLTKMPNTGCSISVEASPLSGRMIFVYAGNMGIAQGMDIFLDLAESMLGRRDIGFLFVGRGSEVQRLRVEAGRRKLNNVAFYDEIDSAEIPGLYAQCHVGLISLDPRHTTHNIPGKFISYMRAGLPVLACVNPGNDLVDIIRHENVGRVCTNRSPEILQQLAEELLALISVDGGLSHRCKMLAEQNFSPSAVVKQIVDALAR